MKMNHLIAAGSCLVLLLLVSSTCSAWAPPPPSSSRSSLHTATTVQKRRQQQASATTTRSISSTALYLSDPRLDEKTFGGYTVKQRLREEVESPFRTVRLFFFGSSTGSALVALYFSLFTLLKAYNAGTYPDALPVDEALQSVGINVAAVVICGFLTYRDWKAGEANLARIAKGGALAKLGVVVTPTTASTGNTASSPLRTLADYRRKSRVLIAAGGKEYISQLCRSLNADQLQDENTIPHALQMADIVVVPVLLEQDATTTTTTTTTRVGDSQTCWKETEPSQDPQQVDRNFDVNRAKDVVAFPRGNAAWTDYLQSEVETAQKQGFDVMDKGFTILVKKNGRILRRATGQPRWGDLLGAMEVMDGKFGMPGDDEKYGS